MHTIVHIRKIEDAICTITTNKTPENCLGSDCCFLIGTAGHICELLDKDLWPGQTPICSVYDFTKWLLENI